MQSAFNIHELSKVAKTFQTLCLVTQSEGSFKNVKQEKKWSAGKDNWSGFKRWHLHIGIIRSGCVLVFVQILGLTS